MGNANNITVLVIDDDASVRLGISILLQKSGFKAFVAGSVAEGLQIWREEREAIDILLVDIIMPTKSGPDLVRELFSIRASRPVVFMTGIEPTQAMDATKGIPDALVLQKPFSLQCLMEAIKSRVPEKSAVAA